jgi:hypothetical protein
MAGTIPQNLMDFIHAPGVIDPKKPAGVDLRISPSGTPKQNPAFDLGASAKPVKSVVDYARSVYQVLGGLRGENGAFLIKTPKIKIDLL